ncbi:MAG: valine--tRNA ligase [Cytophagales bacterium]|nr:valine--tRNA ligase [Cytophagales bacterium]
MSSSSFAKLPPRYVPTKVETRIYEQALKNSWHQSHKTQKKPYTILMPPPNVTGILHMGHVLNNTIQDVLIRRARMQTKEACWIPGLDHASIATEAKVVEWIAQKGEEKEDLGRERFVNRAWEWKERYGNIILEQMKRLGLSADWSRLAFTMDEKRSKQVSDIFLKLHQDGYIYRGTRMVQWDTKAETVLSDEEVYYKEVPGKLYYIRYELVNSPDVLNVATTRPETLLGDTALCVHPKDERYQKFLKQQVYVPLIRRKIPVIADEYVDPSYGTGCLKITPAHDPRDYEIGERHKLPYLVIMDKSGRITHDAGFAVGKDREEAREEVIGALEEKQQLIKVEDIVHKVGFSERTQVVVEPRISQQWFVRMKDLAKPALKAVMQDEIKFHPPKFKNTYRHWMTNIKDWCISRQLWWGHRIPVYYAPRTEEYVVARSREEALKCFVLKGIKVSLEEIKQDEDVLDTWFSSWLWPFSVFAAQNKKEVREAELDYYYPTQVLVTAPEIIFFWVARMIMAGYYHMGKKPFEHVYFHGIVRDKSRRKMSKSLGNSPDPIVLIDKYGADAVRMGMMLCTRAGNDLLFAESLCLQGRNFANKVWNALRLILSWQPQKKTDIKEVQHVAITWFEYKLKKAIQEIENKYQEFRLSEVGLYLYKLIRDDFSHIYLELVKLPSGESFFPGVVEQTRFFLCQLMKLLHPFMPFLTEEVASHLGYLGISISDYPEQDKGVEEEHPMDHVIRTIQTLRAERLKNPKQSYLSIQTDRPDIHQKYIPVFQKLFPLAGIQVKDKQHKEVFSTDPFPKELSEQTRLLCQQDVLILWATKDQTSSTPHEDKGALSHYEEFLKRIRQKLNNPLFQQNAPPQVIERERKKEKDTMEKIAALRSKT